MKILEKIFDIDWEFIGIVFLHIVAIGVFLLAIILLIYGIGDTIARKHTEQLYCQHEFVQIYHYELFKGEKLITECSKCGLKEGAE